MFTDVLTQTSSQSMTSVSLYCFFGGSLHTGVMKITQLRLNGQKRVGNHTLHRFLCRHIAVLYLSHAQGHTSHMHRVAHYRQTICVYD